MPKIKVDSVKCIGCGLCTSIAGEVFEMGEDGKARVVGPSFAKASESKVKEAAESCPVSAITLSH